MFTIVKKISSVLLLILVAASPIACLNINSKPDKKDVNIGGKHGVTVDHDTDGK